MRLGSQVPRIRSVPDYGSSAGEEAVELAAAGGLILDPWQRLVLTDGLGEKPDGTWAAFEVAVEVARQNGKGGILEGRELAGAYLFGERLIVHSAHEFKTASEAQLRMVELIEGKAEFSRRVKRVKWAHGEEGIYFLNGQRILYKTRTKGAGRGFTGDVVILDEAMILPDFAHGVLLPTVSARPNPQIWYMGSPVDQLIHEHGRVFARLRARAIAGGDPSLAYFEWSLDADTPADVTAETAADPDAWAQANPALNIRIAESHVANEQRSMDKRTFAVERLGVGDWPDVTDEAATVIDLGRWRDLADRQSTIAGPVALAFDVSPDRSSAAIAAAGARLDGDRHREVIDHRAGTGWIVNRLAGLAERNAPVRVCCDAAGPAASLLPELAAAGIDVHAVSAKEYAAACGILFDKVEQSRLRHLSTPELNAAVAGARKRPLGDAWAWSRSSSAVDITPLVAATLALFGYSLALGDESSSPLVAWA